MGKKIEIFVTPEGEGARLDVYLAKQPNCQTRSKISRWIREGCVTVNGKGVKASARLQVGQQIVVSVPEVKESSIIPVPMDLDILYEDEDLLVLNKPAGLSVHPGAGKGTSTLVHGLLHHCGHLSSIGGVHRPGIVHRIDKNTSGLLVVAKNDDAHRQLSAQFQARTTRREYHAVIVGNLSKAEGTFQTLFGRSPKDRKKMTSRVSHGKEAVTYYNLIKQFPGLALIRVKLGTGRTHQIRVHFSENGRPVVGDFVYGTKRQMKHLSPPLQEAILQLPYYLLQAKSLGFWHPQQKKHLEFAVDYPEYFKNFLSFLEKEKKK